MITVLVDYLELNENIYPGNQLDHTKSFYPDSRVLQNFFTGISI